ncbi:MULTISPECIES: STAS domain-containing protein [unclassified Streptomyces]|jgi:stage II sporulation protein AA (anti-sigma F factor antagonist)|uniref:STAS domain-containing protein n=1 Tax=unclassified Streptomyces TaxID=2593676 RepID=UPI0034564A52
MGEEEVPGTEHGVLPGQLSVESSTVDDVHVLTLAGEIDHHTGDALRQALDLADAPSPRVVVDMRQVAFMDSSGINVLIAAHQALTQAGGWLRLAGVGRSVMRTLQLVGVDALVDIRETPDQALG